MTDARSTKRAIARVMVWCWIYSRGLPEQVSAIRREELARDLVDHVEWSTSRGEVPFRVARSIYSRALRGAHADLSWRLHQRSWSDLASALFRKFDAGLLAVTLASGFVGVIFSVFLLARDVQATGIVEALGHREVILVAVSTIVMLLGGILLSRPQTRSIGALWMLAATEAVVFVGFPILAETTRVLSVASRSAEWALGPVLAGLGFAAFYSVGALWWLPGSRDARRES